MMKLEPCSTSPKPEAGSHGASIALNTPRPPGPPWIGICSPPRSEYWKPPRRRVERDAGALEVGDRVGQRLADERVADVEAARRVDGIGVRVGGREDRLRARAGRRPAGRWGSPGSCRAGSRRSGGRGSPPVESRSSRRFQLRPARRRRRRRSPGRSSRAARRPARCRRAATQPSRARARRGTGGCRARSCCRLLRSKPVAGQAVGAGEAVLDLDQPEPRPVGPLGVLDPDDPVEAGHRRLAGWSASGCRCRCGRSRRGPASAPRRPGRCPGATAPGSFSQLQSEREPSSTGRPSVS